jgi:hypothetical protein
MKFKSHLNFNECHVRMVSIPASNSGGPALKSQTEDQLC